MAEQLPENLRNRLVAARALAAPSAAEVARRRVPNDPAAGISQAELEARLEPEGRGYGRETLSLWERGKRSPSPTQVRAVARACGLPFEFFTVDFTRLAELVAIPRLFERPEVEAEARERLSNLSDGALAELRTFLIFFDEERAQRDRARRTKQAYDAALDAADAAETPTADGTRDGADASQEASPPPDEETPDTGEQTAG